MKHKSKTSKIANTNKEMLILQKSKGMLEGTSIEFDSKRDIHIYENEDDKLIDALLDDVDGTTFISSLGVAKLFDLQHIHLVNDTIKPLFKRKECVVVDMNNVAIETTIADTMVVQNTNKRPWFVKTTYVAENGKTNPQYLVSSDAFIYLCVALPKARRAGVQEMRDELMIQVIERMRHYQTLTTLNFQDYITDIRQLCKTSRRCLTDAIKWKIENPATTKKTNNDKQLSKEIGQIYAYITKTIYEVLGIPKDYHKGSKDTFPNDILFLIHISESIIASYISTLPQMDKKFNINFISGLRLKMFKVLVIHLEDDKVKEIIAKHFN